MLQGVTLGVTAVVMGVVWIAWIIALLILYHKVFEVYYTSLFQGIMKELFGAFLIGMVLTGLTLYAWWLIAIIIIIAGIVVAVRNGSIAPIIIAIVCAVIIAIAGIQYKNFAKNAETTTDVSCIKIVKEVEC